jgi:hypothetical protein
VRLRPVPENISEHDRSLHQGVGMSTGSG